MKKVLFISLFLFLSFSIFAQTPTGGPDNFGYTWRTNSDPGGPTYNWINIENRPSAVQVTGLLDDNVVGPFPIGFLFNYYNTQYNAFSIGVNGFIKFGNTTITSAYFINPFPVIPTADTKNGYIGVFLTDLLLDSLQTAAGSCWYWTNPTADTLIVSWLEVPFFYLAGGIGLNTFQLIISNPTNSITFQYATQFGTAPGSSSFISIGIESPDGLTGLNPLFDNYPLPNTAIRFDINGKNRVIGKAYVDANNNQLKDPGETPVSNKMFVDQVSGKYVFSTNSGEFSLFVPDSSNFNISPQPINYFSVSPSNYSGNLLGTNLVDSLNDFAFYSASTVDDLAITITPLGFFRPGFLAQYQINYRNDGTTIQSPSIYMFLPQNISYSSATIAPSYVNVDTLMWNLPPIGPLQQQTLQVTVQIGVGVQIGTILNTLVSVLPLVNDLNPSSNYSSREVVVTGSFDPNDILVDKESILFDSLINPPYLDYLIRFQNTGNDTAFNVFISNSIPSEFNLQSLEIISASHPMQFHYDDALNRFVFSFNNILLPDSNVNELMSHGFVRYRIKPSGNLNLGDTIKNSAAIYFDFNAPVLTNTAITIIQNPSTGIQSLDVNTEELLLFPNPVADHLNIKCPLLNAGKVRLSVLDLSGRMLMDQKSSGGTGVFKLSTSDLLPGIYILELQNSIGTVRGKFVKQ